MLTPLLKIPPKDTGKCNALGALVLTELPAMAAQAETALRNSIELDPKSDASWCNLGALLTKHLGNFGEAEIAYRNAIKLNPNDAVHWNNFGFLLTAHLNQHEEAEVAYRNSYQD